MRYLSCLLLLIVMSSFIESVPPVNPVSHGKEIESWREKRFARLKSEDGWLTLIGLFWFQEGENSFGSDPSNRIVLPKGQVPDFAGSFYLEKGSVRIQIQQGVKITSEDKPVESMVLNSDATEKPTILDFGTLRFFVIDRGGKLGLRVRDREHPNRKNFTGLEYYAIDMKWRIQARFEAYNPVKMIPIVNILGMLEDTPSPGALVFSVDGKTYKLDAIAEKGETDLFMIFADQTNGKETYGAGRYLYAAPPGPDNVVVLDFNKAYNPPCVFSHFATCPLPPHQNKLTLRIDAGEKKYTAAK